MVKHNKNTTKNKDRKSQDIEEKICVVKQIKKEDLKLTKKVENGLQTLKKFVESKE
jgi:hypothetical protein